MTILQGMQSIATPWLDQLAFVITQVGSEYAYVGLLVVIYLAVDAKAGRWLGLAVLGGYYLNQHLKELFDTTRPYLLHPELLRGGGASAETAPGPAFPSGHTQAATTFWIFAAALVRRRAFTVVAILIVAAVAVSRVYLGVHWPIDLLGGAVAGLVVVAVAWWLTRRKPLSPAVAIGAFVGLPLLLHLLLPTPDSGRLLGAFAGIATAPLIFRHEPHGGVARRAILALFGLALAVGWLVGTSVTLPEAVKDHRLVEPLRYLVLAWFGTVAAPWLAFRFERRARRAPS